MGSDYGPGDRAHSSADENGGRARADARVAILKGQSAEAQSHDRAHGNLVVYRRCWHGHRQTRLRMDFAYDARRGPDETEPAARRLRFRR
jgi:hypothetical protein